MARIQSTKNYAMFSHSDDNRPLDLKRRKALVSSMKLYGYLPEHPIVIVKGKGGKLVVKDGQHRLAVAEMLGLAVYWTEASVDYDNAIVVAAARSWLPKDYAQKFSANGLGDYHQGLEFSSAHGVPITLAFAMLAGTVSFHNIKNEFYTGQFKVKDHAWADAVANIYGPLVRMCPRVKKSAFVEACMAVCRVAEFDAKRLLGNADRCRDKMVSYSTRDAYLAMLEEVYNFGRSKLFGLKIAAIMAMKDRNCIKRGA